MPSLISPHTTKLYRLVVIQFVRKEGLMSDNTTASMNDNKNQKPEEREFTDLEIMVGGICQVALYAFVVGIPSILIFYYGTMYLTG
ncbi:hypothetical protein TRVA0_024S01354 [Trichomonascus vanleenenianus]|uniref:uncharacterized protein n=1 Tax=Trichomonascus vanleenenianus TaxID=2268995 RepID=UPI003ECA3B51